MPHLKIMFSGNSMGIYEMHSPWGNVQQESTAREEITEKISS